MTRERRHRFRESPSPACLHCPAPVEEGLHFFTSCPRVAGAWDFLFHRACMVLGEALTNMTLLYLTWPPTFGGGAEAAVVQAVCTFTAWACETRELQPPLLPPDLKTRVDLTAEAGPHLSFI